MTEPYHQMLKSGPMLMFTPKPDITLPELVAVVVALKIGLSASLVSALPPEAQRHFEEAKT
jgi:hypothetical protein